MVEDTERKEVMAEPMVEVAEDTEVPDTVVAGPTHQVGRVPRMVVQDLS